MEITENARLSKKGGKNTTVRGYALFVLFMAIVCQQHINAQIKYLINDKEGLDFILNVTVDGKTINGFTREKALLDYTSRFNYRLIKAASSLKHPEIIRFNASLDKKKFEGTLDYLFSSYKIVGEIKEDSICFSLFDKNNKLYKSFNGAKIIHCNRKKYERLVEDIIKVTEEKIFDPKIIQSKKWDGFRKKMRNAAPKISDDLEFQIGFFALTRKIGFSHYYVVKNAAATNTRDIPSLKEINKDIVVLKIGSFYGNNGEIKPLLDTIQQKAYKNLIIDLRDNPGGNFEPASLVANFLTDKVFISGFFPGRKWYEEYNRLPNGKDLDKFNMANGDTTQTWSKYGFYISTKGTGNRFRGNVYFMVNSKTGSTAEALTIGAKEYKLAKIVGQKTAGGLLSARNFKIDEDIMLIVPVNDFVSYKGYRVDKKGIKPDIKTKKGQELKQLIDVVIKEDN